MKRLYIYIISFAILLCLFFSQTALANDTVSVYLDGSKIEMETPPCIINDRTLVPVRSAMEAAGATVGWDDTAKMTTIKKGTTTVKISVGNTTMNVTKNNLSYVVGFDVAPCIINNKTFVAIKSVAEAFDIKVDWDGTARQVILTSKNKIEKKDSHISLEGFYPPTTMSVGSSHIVSGYISTNTILDRLNIKITDKLSGKQEINETEFNIDSALYMLSNIDSRIKFGRLSVGEKLFELTAVTKDETRKTFSYDFSVIKPTGITIESQTNMLWPVPKSGLLTTIFWCDNPFCHSNAGRANGHAAIDISAPENSDVIAVSDGTVIKTGFGDYENGYTGYGNFIVVDHGDGITTQYSHLFSIYVSEGDTLSAGQIIGGVGSTGNSTGNHLDFNIELNGVRANPLYYIDMHPEVRCYEECDIPFFNEAMEKRGLKKLGDF